MPVCIRDMIIIIICSENVHLRHLQVQFWRFAISDRTLHELLYPCFLLVIITSLKTQVNRERDYIHIPHCEMDEGSNLTQRCHVHVQILINESKPLLVSTCYYRFTIAK